MPNLSSDLRHCLSAVLRCALVVAVAIGLLLPRMSAVLAEVLPGVQTVVICTGYEITTLTLGPDGNPIETDAIATPHCTLGDVVETMETPTPDWVALVAPDTIHPPILLHLEADQDRLSQLRLSRAPPRLS